MKTNWNQVCFYVMVQDMNKCPFFYLCGGCKYDFSASDYREKKCTELPDIKNLEKPIWAPNGCRVRADFCFSPNAFGFYAVNSKDIIKISNCPNLCSEINQIIPLLSSLPWVGTGSCLVTKCDNGIDICVKSSVDYVDSNFITMAKQMPVLRFVWNDKVLVKNNTPMVRFGNRTVEYPSGAFLQPIPADVSGLRDLVLNNAHGAKKVADLFCGLGNFTYDLHADGFDIFGIGVNRDLFKHPLTLGMLEQYDCVIMDPPRAGAMAQSEILAKSNVHKIIYVSCNPHTFKRDANILVHGGYSLQSVIPIDQFVGSAHWEIFSIFIK
ncbi:MAG: hypothetical protein ACLRFI_02350 [Alphaproteobacteria bacterium]